MMDFWIGWMDGWADWKEWSNTRNVGQRILSDDTRARP